MPKTQKPHKIVRGPNSIDPNRVIVDEHAQLLSNTLKVDYMINQTKLSRLEASVDKKMGVNVAEVRKRLEALAHTQESIRADRTRTDGGKLSHLATKVEAAHTGVRKLLDSVEMGAASARQEASAKLFSQNLKLSAAELQILPLMAQTLGNDRSTLSENTFMQAEARVFLTMINDYPNLVNPEQFDPKHFSEMRADLDSRFTPEAVDGVKKADEIFRSVRDLKISVTEAGELSAPKEVIKSITASRVA